MYVDEEIYKDGEIKGEDRVPVKIAVSKQILLY